MTPARRKPNPTAAQVIAALNHPLRRQIMRQMLDREETSSKEAADAFGVDINTIAYHNRILAKYGIVEVVRTRRVRGAIQYFHRLDLGEHEDWVRAALKADASRPA